MSDVEQAVSVEEATDQAMTDSSIGEQSEQTSFLDMDFDDGETRSFKDADELKAWAKEGVLRNKDYTQKTQTLAEQRRQFDDEKRERQQRWDADTKTFEQLKSRYDKWDETLKKRPDLLRQLERIASQPASPDEIVERSQGYADEKYKALEERLNKWDEDRQRQELEQQRDAVYASLAEKYPDFNREEVDRVLGMLEADNLEPLLDIAYKASRFNPEGMEERVVEKLRAKQPAKIAAGGGVAPSTKSLPTDLNAMHDVVMQEYVGNED